MAQKWLQVLQGRTQKCRKRMSQIKEGAMQLMAQSLAQRRAQSTPLATSSRFSFIF
jgi:hypothetical protein